MAASSRMEPARRFGEILLRAGLIDRQILTKALGEFEGSPLDIGHFLVEHGRLKPVDMVKAVSKSLGLTRVGLEHAQPDGRALDRVGADLCRQHWVIPIELETSAQGEVLHLAMANPIDTVAIQAVAIKAACPLRVLVSAGREIRTTISRFFPRVIEPEAKISSQGAVGLEDLFDLSEPTPVVTAPRQMTVEDIGLAQTEAIDLHSLRAKVSGQKKNATTVKTPIIPPDGGGRTTLEKLTNVLGPPETPQARCLMLVVAQLAEKKVLDLDALMDQIVRSSK